MPKSKRQKVVALTKTDKRVTRAAKEQLVEKVQQNLDAHRFLWIYSVDNMRNAYLKDIRAEWKTRGRFFWGRNRVMAKALGESPESEHAQNTNEIAQRLQGNVGLLFTNEPTETVIQYFSTFTRTDYIRSPTPASRTVVLPPGPLVRGPLSLPIPSNLEAHLRKLGMPTRLVNGQVVLDREYTVCTEGEPVTPEGAQVLQQMWLMEAEFKVRLVCCWDKDTGRVEDVSA
ncbi:mRNA turnover 4 [Gonapodya sp. JEL0774]|nr:mRNA turnover 4 [Gonapodya sp. JEL0774]